MKKIKKYIIFFTILLIAIIIALVVMTTGRRKINSEFKVGEYGDADENYEENHVIEETVKKVDNRTEYYIVKNIIDKYFEYISKSDKITFFSAIAKSLFRFSSFFNLSKKH